MSAQLQRPKPGPRTELLIREGWSGGGRAAVVFGDWLTCLRGARVVAAGAVFASVAFITGQGDHVLRLPRPRFLSRFLCGQGKLYGAGMHSQSASLSPGDKPCCL